MASGYPTSVDTFATTSPTNLGDDDSTGRNHAERHDDMGAAMNKVQTELGVDPAGQVSTVRTRLDSLNRTLIASTGQWFGPPDSSSGMTPTINYLYAAPFTVPISMTIDAMSVYCQTSQASSVMRLGIYANTDATDKPGTLILDAGTADMSSGGEKNITGLSQALSPGLVWLVAVAQTAAGTMQTYYTYGHQRIPNATYASGTTNRAYYVTGVTGALPGSFGTVATSGMVYGAPYIALKRT